MGKTYFFSNQNLRNILVRGKNVFIFSNQTMNNSVNGKHIHDMKWLVNDVRNINIVHE